MTIWAYIDNDKVIGWTASPQTGPNWFEIEEDDPRFLAYLNPQPTEQELADAARLDRDTRLKTIYDPGVNMALRALRMASTPEQTTYAQGKISELDIYAELLLAIPDQEGFPQTITWPVAPTK